jgi:hypothetical protein
MKERPIIMSAESVRAILGRRKTQARIVINPMIFIEVDNGDEPPIYQDDPEFPEAYRKYGTNRYGAVGDRLWVRETYQFLSMPDHEYPMDVDWYEGAPRHALENGYSKDSVVYRADSRGSDIPWRSPMSMPRWASRITIEITDIKVERLQDISEEDAIAEGVDMESSHASRCIDIKTAPYDNDLIKGSAILTVFKNHWDSLNSKRGYSWKSNPMVRAISFKVVE